MKKIAIALAMIVTTAYGQQTDCASFSAAIEKGLKLEASGLTESGASRSAGAATASAAATNILSNLQIMMASKCQMPTAPIDPSVYTVSAFKCITARSTPGASMLPDECKMENWQRSK